MDGSPAVRVVDRELAARSRSSRRSCDNSCNVGRCHSGRRVIPSWRRSSTKPSPTTATGSCTVVCRRSTTMPSSCCTTASPDSDCSPHSSTTPRSRRSGSTSRVASSSRVGGRPELTTLVMTAGEVEEVVERMLARAGRRLDRSQPFVDARLPDGSRLHVVIPPVTDAWAVNIRKFVNLRPTRSRSSSDSDRSPPRRRDSSTRRSGSG